MESPFHGGERAVQERAGVRETAERVGRSIDSEIGARAEAFLTTLSTFVIGAVDATDRPWASLLTGPPGFVRAPDPRTLRVDAALHPADPSSPGLHEGAAVGTLGIDYATRRRVRINGVVRSRSDSALSIDVHQAYANCPKYIVPRAGRTSVHDLDHVRVSVGERLSEKQMELVRRADTFFVSTVAPGAGADVSHRGGPAGFVHVEPTRIVWPDYPGNSMFNTLGNIHVNPRAGVTFVDFTTGTLVQATGVASIDWSPVSAVDAARAERLVRLELTRVLGTRRRNG